VARYRRAIILLYREEAHPPAKQLGAHLNEGKLETASAAVELSPTALSIPARLREVASRQPHAPALMGPEHVLTYGELEPETHRIAAALSAAQAPNAGPVALLLDHGPAAILAMLGTLTAGRTYVPLDPGDPPDRVQLIVEDCGATMLVTQSSYMDQAQQMAAAGCTVVNLEDLPAATEQSRPSVSPDALAYIYYTSGSTGRPKGVPQTHRSLVHHATNYARSLEIQPGDRVSLLFTLSFSASIMDIYGGLLSGAAVVPFDLRKHGAARLADWITSTGITVLHSVPSLFRHLLSHVDPAQRFPQVRAIDLAGEPVFADDVMLFRKHFPAGCLLVNHLAASEVHVIAQLRLDDQEDLGKGALSVGAPAPGIEVRLLRADGSEAPPGDAGEIEIRSRFTSPGYWRNPELTAGAFSDDPRGDGWRIYRSSDLARKDAEGRLFFLGRKDSRVKVRGHTVDPSEVEAALHRLDSLREAVVVATRPTAPTDSAHLAAFIIPAGAEPLTRAALRRHLRKLLPTYMIPEDLVFLDRFPTTATGKIDRSALSRMDPKKEPEASEEREAPVGEFEHTVASLFGALLGVETVGRDDNFFDLGGDSLKASELQTELLRSLGVQLDLQDLVRNATVREMARAVRCAGTRPEPVDSVMLPVRTEGTKPKLFLVHGALGQAFISPVFLDALGPEQPLYAFQARGLNGKERTNRTVTSMAIDYNRTLQSEQPEGPYVLCGLCAGGLVTLEMARRLQTIGHPPGAVILIDPPRLLIEGYDIQTKIVRMGSIYLARLSLLWGGGRRTQDLHRSLRRQEGEGRIAPTRDTQARVNASLRAALDFKMAVLLHRPRPYKGTVDVIRSRKRAGSGGSEPWRRHVDGTVRFFEAGAKHADLLVPGNQAFAQKLRRCIDDVIKP